MFVLHERNYRMKNRIQISLLLQTIFVVVLVGRLLDFEITVSMFGWDLFNVLFSFFDNELFLGVGGILFLMQCIDAWKLYPNRRKRIKYFFQSAGVLFLIAVGLLVRGVSNGGFGTYLLILLVFFGGSFLGYTALFFIPYYYFKTWINVIKLVESIRNIGHWKETGPLDDHFFTPKL